MDKYLMKMNDEDHSFQINMLGNKLFITYNLTFQYNMSLNIFHTKSYEIIFSEGNIFGCYYNISFKINQKKSIKTRYR